MPDARFCPRHPLAEILEDGSCEGGCELSIKALDTQTVDEGGDADQRTKSIRGADNAHAASVTAGGVSESYERNDAPSLYAWKTVAYERAKLACDGLIRQDPTIYRPFLAATELETFIETVNKVRPPGIPEGLSLVALDEEAETIARELQRIYALPETINDKGLSNLPEVARISAIQIEDAEQAIVSNAEYLSHAAIVERIYYTHHASLHVGGKHEGKTTATKTDALAIASGGYRLYGREVMQTPVIYAASEDEYPSVRMDLLRMGWNPSVPLHMVRISRDGDRDFVLEDIAALALKLSCYFVILDMLFDFAPVQDEIAYAETRAAMGHVVDLAVAIKGHVKATHHSPKWFPDAAAAGKAALGSQGIAARFSPIILSRMWVPPTDENPGLFTMESTMTRDPRGLAIPVTKVTKNDLGWAVVEEEFKSWMKWPIYSQRIVDLFEGSEPDKRWTAPGVAEALGISRPDAQNAMMRMVQGDNPVLERRKKVGGRGGGYSYGLISSSYNGGQPQNGTEPVGYIPPSTGSRQKDDGPNLADQGRFGYKD